MKTIETNCPGCSESLNLDIVDEGKQNLTGIFLCMKCGEILTFNVGDASVQVTSLKEIMSLYPEAAAELSLDQAEIRKNRPMGL